jgi:hypothetical protein
MQGGSHRRLLVTNEHLLSVHMCTGLNLAITERTGGAGWRSKGSGGVPPPRFIRREVPAGAASRVSLQRGVIEGVGAEARHHGGNGVQSLGKHADSGEMFLLLLALARGTGIRCSGV